MYPPMPRVIQFETTTICGGNCPHCPQRSVKRAEPTMSIDLILKIIEGTKGTGTIYRPFIAGEPLADERMVDIVRMLKEDKTATVELHSNGLFLSSSTGMRLLDAGLDVMRLSIDGHWSETMEKARPGLDNRRVVRNAEQFLRYARDYPDVKVEVRMIADYARDEEEKKLYRDHWEWRYGANVIFTSLYNWPWTGQAEHISASCPKINDEMFILCDGRVVLCCWDAQARAVIGDITNTSVLDVWNGKELARCRRLLDQGQRDQIELCSRCDAYTCGDD